MEIYLQIPDESEEAGYRILVLRFGKENKKKPKLDDGYKQLLEEKRDFARNNYTASQLKKNFLFSPQEIKEIRITEKYGVKRYVNEEIVNYFIKNKGAKIIK